MGVGSMANWSGTRHWSRSVSQHIVLILWSHNPTKKCTRHAGGVWWPLQATARIRVELLIMKLFAQDPVWCLEYVCSETNTLCTRVPIWAWSVAQKVRVWSYCRWLMELAGWLRMQLHFRSTITRYLKPFAGHEHIRWSAEMRIWCKEGRL
jgi:hypothetical protein